MMVRRKKDEFFFCLKFKFFVFSRSSGKSASIHGEPSFSLCLINVQDLNFFCFLFQTGDLPLSFSFKKKKDFHFSGISLSLFYSHLIQIQIPKSMNFGQVSFINLKTKMKIKKTNEKPMIIRPQSSSSSILCY